MRRFLVPLPLYADGVFNGLRVLSISSSSGVPASSRCTAQPAEFASPTALYLRQRLKVKSNPPQQPRIHKNDETMRPAQRSDNMADQTSLLQRALNARSISTFQESCEALLALERRKLYAVHRPTSRLAPSDYVLIFHCAKEYLRCSAHASLHHPVVVQLLDVFLELWGKPRNPHYVSSSTHAPHDPEDRSPEEWNAATNDDDETMCRVVAAALCALPPRDALHVMSDCCLDNTVIDLYLEAQQRTERTTGAEGSPPTITQPTQRGGVEQTCAVMKWCFEHTDPKRPHKALAASGNLTPVAQKLLLQRLRTAQHPAVVGAVVSSMISLGASSSKLLALELCDAYVVLWLKSYHTVDKDAINTVIRSATEAAAIAGDSELVARCIFMLFRVKGALAAPSSTQQEETTSHRPLSVPDLVRKWMSVGGNVGDALRPLNISSQEATFDDTVAVLMQNAIRAANSERGTDHAEALFEALRPGCTWKAVANMSLELLNAFIKLNIASQARSVPRNSNMSEVDHVTLSLRAIAVLGKMATVYPRHPNAADEKRMQLAVRRAMQVHFEFLHITVPPVQPPELPSTSPSHPPPMELYWPRPRHPTRILELYERLPVGCNIRRDVRYLALSSACFLQPSDSGSSFANLLHEEQSDRPNNLPSLTAPNPVGSALLAATFMLGCLCWHGNSASWDETMADNDTSHPAPTRTPTAWVRGILRTGNVRLAVCHVVCGALQRHACPPLVQHMRFLHWCQKELSDACGGGTRRSVADVLAKAMVHQPHWKLEGADGASILLKRMGLLSSCIEELLASSVAKAPPHAIITTNRFLPHDRAATDMTVPEDQAVIVLHPSVACLTPAQFKAFLESVVASQEGKGKDSCSSACVLVVPWELLSPSTSSATAAAVCRLLHAAAGEIAGTQLIVAVSDVGSPPMADGEPMSWVLSTAKTLRGHPQYASSTLSIWTEGQYDESTISGLHLTTISSSAFVRRQSLEPLQQVLSMDRPKKASPTIRDDVVAKGFAERTGDRHTGLPPGLRRRQSSSQAQAPGSPPTFGGSRGFSR